MVYVSTVLRALQILFSMSCFYYILSVSLYSSIIKASLSPDLWLLAVAVCIMISGTVSWLRMTGSVETVDNEGNFSRHTHLTQWDPRCPAGRLQGDLFCFASRNASRSKLNSSEGLCIVEECMRSTAQSDTKCSSTWWTLVVGTSTIHRRAFCEKDKREWEICFGLLREEFKCNIKKRAS